MTAYPTPDFQPSFLSAAATVAADANRNVQARQQRFEWIGSPV